MLFLESLPSCAEVLYGIPPAPQGSERGKQMRNRKEKGLNQQSLLTQQSNTTVHTSWANFHFWRLLWLYFPHGFTSIVAHAYILLAWQMKIRADDVHSYLVPMAHLRSVYRADGVDGLQEMERN